MRERRLAVILLGWVLVGALATATLQTATWHHNRYQMPLYPALLVPLALALIALAEEFAQRSVRLFLPAAAVLAVLSLAWAVFSLAASGRPTASTRARSSASRWCGPAGCASIRRKTPGAPCTTWA